MNWQLPNASLSSRALALPMAASSTTLLKSGLFICHFPAPCKAQAVHNNLLRIAMPCAVGRSLSVKMKAVVVW